MSDVAGAPRGRGRPIKFDAELRSNYLALLAVGTGRREAARQVGMSPRQVAAWRQAHEDFRLECEDAEASANEPVTLALYKAAKNGEPWAVKLWLTNRDAGNWKDKVEVDQRVSGTVSVEAPGLAEVLALGAELDARRRELDGSAEVGAIEAESWEAEPAPSAKVGPEGHASTCGEGPGHPGSCWSSTL